MKLTIYLLLFSMLFISCGRKSPNELAGKNTIVENKADVVDSKDLKTAKDVVKKVKGKDLSSLTTTHFCSFTHNKINHTIYAKTADDFEEKNIENLNLIITAIEKPNQHIKDAQFEILKVLDFEEYETDIKEIQRVHTVYALKMKISYDKTIITTNMFCTTKREL